MGALATQGERISCAMFSSTPTTTTSRASQHLHVMIKLLAKACHSLDTERDGFPFTGHIHGVKDTRRTPETAIASCPIAVRGCCMAGASLEGAHFLIYWDSHIDTVRAKRFPRNLNDKWKILELSAGCFFWFSCQSVQKSPESVCSVIYDDFRHECVNGFPGIHRRTRHFSSAIRDEHDKHYHPDTPRTFLQRWATDLPRWCILESR